MQSSIQFLLKKFTTSLCQPQGCPYSNLLNLVSFDEFDHTDEESTRIICITSYSTKIHHKKYEGFFILQFLTWMHKFAVQGSLLFFPIKCYVSLDAQFICDSDKCNLISINWSMWKLWSLVWKTVLFSVNFIAMYSDCIKFFNMSIVCYMTLHHGFVIFTSAIYW